MPGALSMRRLLLVMVCVLALTGWVTARDAWLSTAPNEPDKAASPELAASRAGNLPQLAVVPAPAAQPATPPGRPYLGIRGEVFKTDNLTGLRIIEVFPDSPAAMAGLRSKYDPQRSSGDLITRVNDRLILSGLDDKFPHKLTFNDFQG